MKLRRILASVLAFAMVITASPLENVSFAAESTQTISAVDTTYMHWSANMKTTTENSINKLACQNQGVSGGLRADMPSIKTLHRDVLANFNETNKTWPWFAYRISVTEQGTYTLGLKINGCGGSTRTIPICVDDKVYTLTYTGTNQAQTTEVELSKGEHIVVMFSPMPEQLNDSIQGNGTYYPWCNFESVLVDSRLTVVKKADKELSDANVEACFYSRVEAGDTAYATSDFISNDGGYKLNGSNAKDPVASDNIQTWDELVTSNGKLNYLAKESTPYVQYIVDAESAGIYHLNVGYQFGGTATDGMDYTTFAVIVNDDVYKVEQKTGSSNIWANQTLDIELKKGRNIIRTTGLLKDSDWYNAGAWLNHDYISIGIGAQFVPVAPTSVNGGDETKVLSHIFNDNGDTLGGLNKSLVANLWADLATIDMLSYAGNLVERWPFASAKVQAEKDGYYDITLNTGMNTSATVTQLGMLVDGTSYSVPYKNVSTAGIDASVYLTEGDHVITFFVPMPANVYDSREASWAYYSWMDYNSITFGTGLTVQNAPTINDIKAHLGTTISAGDEALLVNKFGEVSAGSGDKIRHNKYASPDRSVLTAKNITLENVLDLGYDKLPYIAYEVNVENAGTYEIGAIVKTKSGTTSQMGLIIDGTQVKGIPLAATAKEEYVSTQVELSAGTHTLMLTCAMPKDSTCTVDYPWLDVFELCISNGATIGNIHAQDTSVTVEMENPTYVSGGTQTPYAGASAGIVIETEINSSEKLAEVWKSDGNKLLQIDWGQMNYAEFATTGTAGEHEIQLKVIATCTPDKKVADKEPEVYVYVNGEAYKKQLDAWNTFETITIEADLVDGINVFKCFAVADDASGDTGIFFDTLYFDTTNLTAVSLEDVAETKTEISFADTTQVFTHKYPVSEDGTKLANPVAGDMQYRKYYIDALNINQLTYVPYAAVKVAAENAGYYEIEIEANVKTGDAAADRIAMLVDGKAYTLRYKKSGADTLSTMIYLEKGTHMLIFTSPMPQTYDEVKDVVYPTGENADFTELKNLYPWFDMKTLILDKGLSIVEKPGYGDVDFSEVIDSVDTIIDAGDETLVLPEKYTDNDAILDGASRDELKNNRVSLETLLLHGFDKAPYASFKVTAPADGTYDIYALVATDANLTSDQIAFIVDRMQVYAVTVEKKADNQIIRATVELTKGTHSIIFTAPMPLTDAEAQNIPAGETDNWAGMNSKYRWMNYIRFGIDKDLTLVSGLTPSITNGIEAEDEDYVNYHGDFEAQIYPGATGNHAVNGGGSLVDVDEFSTDAKVYDWNKMSCIEFAVNAQSAGEQTISIGVIATNAAGNLTAATPKLLVYVNGAWQEAEITNWNEFGEVEIKVNLAAGVNVIKCIAAYREEVAGTRVIYDYIELATGLTQVKTTDFEIGTVYNGSADSIAVNRYNKGATLNGASLGDMRWSRYYVEGLEMSEMHRVPYAAVEVTVEEERYYDIAIDASPNTAGTSTQIALIVDGKAYPMTFVANDTTTLSASIKLTEGTHLLMFTSPMPKTINDRPESTNDTAAYPWFNFNKFYFDNGMQLTEGVNVADVIAKVEETTKVSKNWSSYKDSNGDKVTDYLSAITDDMKNNRVSIETLLEVGLTRIPYISVTVKAEQDGWYDVYATVNANKNRTSETVAMIVDGTEVHTISLVSGDKNQNIGRYIYLKEGTHTITMTATMPATDAQAQAITDPSEDQWAAMNQAYPWFNFYSFTVDGRLEVVEGEANPLKDASVLFVGDSITNGNRTDTTDGVSWANKIGTWNGMDYTNAGIKGATISTLRDKIIRHQLMSYASQDFDYLIMHGGINDAMAEAPIGEIEDSYDVADFDNSTLIGALETEFYYAYENFDGAKMGYIINYATPRSDWGGYTQDPSEYYNAIKQVCAKWNIPYIDLFEGKVVVNGQELSYSYDILKVDSEDKNFASNKSTEIHLSDEGYRVISPYIETWMKTLSVTPNPLQEENRWKYVEAGNADKVLFNGFTASEGTLVDRVNGAMAEDEASIELLPYAKNMIGDWAFASIKVNAETAGDYRIFVEMNAKNETQMGMLVDGEAYTLNYSKNDGFFEYMGQTISLSEGTHYITFTTAMPEKNADVIGAAWTIYPWTNMASIVVDPSLEVLAKPTLEEITSKLSSTEDKGDTVVDAGDETNVLAKDFDDQGDTLGNSNTGDLKWDALTLDEFTYDNLARMPYFAMKVTAEEDGYYDVLLRIDTNEKTISDQLGLLIDGKELQILSFVPSENTKVSARIYLEKGTHTLTFTSPMPETKAEFEAYLEEYNANLPEGEKELTRGNGITHPWMDVNSVTLSKGLTVESVPTRDEIEAPFYNRVEAENGDYVLYNNYEPTPEASKNASNGYVIGGQMRWIFEQNFEELTAWLDAKHNSYIEYAVVAPADGEYNIRLGFLAGAKDESVAKPYIAVIVNGTTHKVQYTEEWNVIQKTELTVNLKEGLNIIRCTSYTVEQEGYEGRAWINHDFLDVDKKLTAVKRSSVKVEAENSAFVNKFKVQDGADYEAASGKVLGSADRKYISGLQLTLDKLNTANLKQVPYASFTVEAPMNGYYAMSLDMSTDGRLKRGTIGMLVDGQMNAVKYARTDKSTAGGRAYILTYLTKGEHVLTFTIPMPADDTVEFNYSYNVANFDSLTLYDGLKLSKTQKAPTTEADYTRIEVEEHAMFNLNSNNGTAAGNAYYKVSQSVAEMFRDGIDGARTPYAELTIRASEAGAYTLYVGTSYGMTKGCTQDEIAATFVVDTNGKLQTKTVQASKNGAWSIVPVTVNLEKGTNKVRFTHFGSDSQCGGTTWIDFDYIEMSEATAAKLNFAKTSLTLEAEDGIFVGYNAESGEAYSGGQYVGSADYGYIDENDVTFENLNVDDLDEIPRVTYNFEVEKAGKYTLTIGFAAGLYKYLTAEMAEGQTGGFAVIVNGTSKHLVEYELTTANSHLSRMITVDLVEGENEITITTTLADYIIGHTPRDDEKYRLIWLDHDYLVLSEGLSRGKEPEKYGLEDSDYNHAQITLKTPSEDESNTADEKRPGGIIGSVSDFIESVVKDAADSPMFTVILGVVAAAVAFFAVIFLGKKKKDKEQEDPEKIKKEESSK